MSQSLEQSLNRYDFTAIMAMPYMEPWSMIRRNFIGSY
ncbi:poly-beta-1,6-N-acetyl-D-glucosamine N-deacetylase PgaB [Acinetobacter indicus]